MQTGRRVFILMEARTYISPHVPCVPLFSTVVSTILSNLVINHNKHAVEVGELLVLVVEASNALIDLGMLPIRDIPQLPKMAQEVLKAEGVILECM
jgi:hypothetical protein